MAESKYFPDLQDDKDKASVEPIKKGFSLVENDINAVQTTAETAYERANQSITVETAEEEYQKKLTFDDTPIKDSPNPVTSGGMHNALAEKLDVVIGDIAMRNTYHGGEGVQISENRIEYPPILIKFDNGKTAPDYMIAYGKYSNGEYSAVQYSIATPNLILFRTGTSSVGFDKIAWSSWQDFVSLETFLASTEELQMEFYEALENYLTADSAADTYATKAETANLKTELESYIDETILGGAW